MGRRKRNVAAVSLFAFQDIITSVSGIIIVMMMLLSLELVDRKALPPPQSAETLEQLKAAISQAEHSLRQLTTNASSQDELIAQLAKTSTPELIEEKHQLQTRQAKLTQSIQELRMRQEALEREQKSIAVEFFDAQSEIEEVDRLSELARALEITIEAERVENRLVYSVPRGFQENGWLVLLEEGNLRVASLSVAAPPLTFTSSKQFLAWLKPRMSNSTYLLLIIRPNGISLFQEVEPELVKIEARYGFDLVGQEEVVLDPKKGALP